MAAHNAFSTKNEHPLPLHRFLLDASDVLREKPVQVVRPLVQCLAEIHAKGRAHGAVCAGRISFSPQGVLNAPYFEARDGSSEHLKLTEIYYYYPAGQGSTLEEQQQRDVQALANVLHLLMLGFEPPPPAFRGGYRLSEMPHLEPWPPAFVQSVERLLTQELHDSQPPLQALLQALEPETKAETVDELLPAVPHTSALEETLPPPPPEAEAETEVAVEPSTEVESGISLIKADEPEITLPEMTPGIPQHLEPQPEANEPPPAAIVNTSAPAASQLPPVRLPNGTVGRNYLSELLPLLSNSSWTFSAITAEEDFPAGLVCDGTVLSGVPQAAGEYEIPVQCAVADAPPERPSTLSRFLLLTINPDPQSLWKNLDSDQSAPFWKPDLDKRSLPDSPLLVAGASRRGRSHAHVGSCRDDDLSLTWFPSSGWYALTVADGAGSAKYSRQGARIACEKVADHHAQVFQEGGVDDLAPLAEAWAADQASAGNETAVRHALYRQFGQAALAARKAIEEQAEAVDATLRDFHTTLITTVARPLADGRWFLAAFSVGDGAAAVAGAPQGTACLLTKPDGGEFAGQTLFLTMKEALATWEGIMNRISFAVVPSFDALVLVTDGISDPKFNSEASLSEPASWAALWSEVRPLVEEASSRDEAAQRMLDWMNFPSPGHHDDRTIAVLCATHLPPTP